MKKKIKYILIGLGILLILNLIFFGIISNFSFTGITGRVTANATRFNWSDEFDISDMKEGDIVQLPNGKKLVLLKKGVSVNPGEVLDIQSLED